jgi:uncharacterized surface anchored protein
MARTTRSILFLSVLLSWSAVAHAQITLTSVTGTVTDADASAIPGVEVTLAGAGVSQRSVTDPKGRYRFARVPPGKYVVRAELSGYDAVERSVQVAPGSALNLDLVLPVAPTITGTIRGTVTDTGKNALAEATITMRDASGNETTVRTDRQGKYDKAGLTPGHYKVTAKKIGYASSTKSADVKRSGTVVVDFALRKVK